MLLIIHNLPNKMRYADVKALIRDRCGLTEIILDNLTYVHPDSYKVTVGLTDENDAAILFKNLNGLDCMGQKLFVEDLRKKKQSSKNLDYSGGIQMQQKEQGNNIGGVQKNISGMQPITKSFYGPMNTYSSSSNLQSNQESAYQYLAPVSQEPNSMMMNTQPPVPYVTGMGGKYGASCTTIIPNTNTPSYNVSSSFGNDNDQQGIYNSNDSQSNFISYSAKKPFYQSYNVNQDSSRYFQKKNDEPPTSDNRQSLDRHTRDTSDRSKRMPPIRNERETYDSHNRSNTSNVRRFDDWNRSFDFSRRSDISISYPIDRNNKRKDNHSDRNQRQVGDDFSRHADSHNSYSSDSRNNKRRDNYSDRNQRQAGDTYNRSFDNNYKDNVGGNRAGNNYSKHSSSGYNTYSDDYSSQYDKSAYTDGDYNRPNNLNPRQTDNNSFFNRSNSRGKNEFAQSYRAGSRGIASDQGFVTRKVERNNKQNPARNQQQFPYSRGNAFKEARKPMNAPPQPLQYPRNKEAPQALNKDSKSKKKDISALTPQELKNRDETWRSQATSAIAKDLVMNCGNTAPFLKQYNFINYLKPFIKSRINEMIGKRVAVPLDQILDEYNQRYRPGTQKAFLNDIIKQFQESSTAELGDVSGGVEASGSATDINKGIKRAVSDDIGNLNPAKKSKKQSNLHPYNVLNQPIVTSERLPKYPDGDKKAYNQLKRQMKFGDVDIGDVYEIDSQLKKVRDDEINALCNVFLDECKNPADENEAKVCKRIITAVDGLKKELRLSITKRVLNITHNIPLRIYANQKIQSTEIDNHLKKLGIISLRKSRGRKLLYIAICTSFNTHDKLCDLGRMEIGSLTLLFKPMNSGKLKKVKSNIENDGNKKDAGYTFDKDVTDDIELFGDGDIGSDEEDYDEEHNDDNDVIELQNDDYNDVEIIDDKHGVICIDDDKTNVENKNTDGAKSEISQTKAETSKSEKISEFNSEKSNDNKIQKSESENLLKDIQTLAYCISNEENVNDVNINKASTTGKTNDRDNPIAVDVEDTKPNYEDCNIDIANITQDDLEDF